MSDFTGRTLGAYKLEAMLGKGGMATVYRAFQTSVKRYVAIKVMSPEIADQPGFVERFSREAEVIASLEHPHILPVIDYGTEDGIHYLVMRYIEGGSLDDKMRKANLSLQETSRLISQIASALNYAHDRGVIHRDMKPNNVLLDKQDNAYITDFGIARLVHGDHKLTSTGSILGTPAYMAPEQAMGQPVDARADIYTLGVMLYEMVLNRLPFVADTPVAMIFQHVHEKPADPAFINPNLPSSIVNVLNRAMAKNPDDRYQSANELASAFAEAVANRGTAARTPLPSDMEGTFVGGPLTPMPVSSTKAARPASPTAPPPQKTMAYGSPSGTQPTPQAAQRSPLPIVIGIAVAVVLLLGGAFLVINNNNNAAVAAQQTQTQVAVIASSATKTSTSTPVATATPTATTPPTKTPTLAATNTKTTAPTITPNLTRTAFTERLDKTASALAKVTNTPVPPPTDTPEDNNDNGDNSAVQSTIDDLVKNGVLDTDAGKVAQSADKIDVVIENENETFWDDIENRIKMTDFVASTDVSWDSPDENMECGFALRYSPATGNKTNWSFYIVSLNNAGHVKAWVRDPEGFRNDPLFDQQSDLIHTGNREVNHLMVIGQGDTFRIFIDNHYIGKFSEDTYTSGSVEALGSRFKGSQGLVCTFRNVWVWQIQK